MQQHSLIAVFPSRRKIYRELAALRQHFTRSLLLRKMTSRRFFVGGNWKMNGNRASINELVATLNASGDTTTGESTHTHTHTHTHTQTHTRGCCCAACHLRGSCAHQAPSRLCRCSAEHVQGCVWCLHWRDKVCLRRLMVSCVLAVVSLYEGRHARSLNDPG